jgi:hypothetical protein
MPVGGQRGLGRPKATFRHTHEHMVRRLGKVGEDKVDPQQWMGRGMYESAQDRASNEKKDRVSWRARVAKLSLQLSKPGSYPARRSSAHGPTSAAEPERRVAHASLIEAC